MGLDARKSVLEDFKQERGRLASSPLLFTLESIVSKLATSEISIF